jgi:uncharacterized protein YndB with AHSA1/START domain
MTKLAYSVERLFPVSREELWEAWTDADALQHWYCGPTFSVHPNSTLSDLAVGGRWTSAVDAPDNSGTAYFWGRYTEVQPMIRAEHTLFYSTDSAEFFAASESGPSHRVVLEFEPRDNGAWVRYSQFGEMPAEMAEGARQGMEQYLDNLALYLA